MTGRYKVVTLCGSTRFKEEFMAEIRKYGKEWMRAH